MKERANYGLDAPGIIRNFFIAGILLFACGLVVQKMSGGDAWKSVASIAFFASAGYCFFSFLGMNLYSRIGKFHHRDRMLAMIPWKGDETVLDIGTGRGLLLIGAAKRVPSGKVIGTDVWIAGDLSANCAENTLRNSELEKVRDRVEVRTEDARALTLKSNSVDVAVSLLCLHNVVDAGGRFDAKGREEACREIARVLKPGGVAVISDGWYTDQYEKVFRDAGLSVKRSPPFFFKTFPPLRIVHAVKE